MGHCTYRQWYVVLTDSGSLYLQTVGFYTYNQWATVLAANGALYLHTLGCCTYMQWTAVLTGIGPLYLHAVGHCTYRQWAAVTTQRRPITTAPQLWASQKSKTRLACHGHEYGITSAPPMIRRMPGGRGSKPPGGCGKLLPSPSPFLILITNGSIRGIPHGPEINETPGIFTFQILYQ